MIALNMSTILPLFLLFCNCLAESVNYRERFQHLKGENNPDFTQVENEPLGFSLEPEYHWQLLLYEEIADLFEGDIQLHHGEKPPITENLNARRGSEWRWPNATIPYVIDKTATYSEFQLETIQMAMREYQRYTCIRWIPRTTQPDYISIFNNSGCWSYVGCQREGMQRLSLKSDNSGTCLVKGIIQHEMMHAAGFYHEQSRTDRDDYINIFWNDIITDKQHNFLKYSVDHIQMLGVQYDYGSVMHYGNLSFSNNRSRNGYTILPKRQGAIIGQRRGFSPLDVLKLNKYYGCPIPINPPSPTDQVINPRMCSFDTGWCGWTQDYKVVLDGSTREYDQYTDDFDWMTLKSTTPSSNTGPKTDHTSTIGKYIYAEASSPRVEGDETRIRSPWIQGYGLTCVTFWYNMFTFTMPDPMGALRVYTEEEGSRAGKRLRWIRRGTHSAANTQWRRGYFQMTTMANFQVLFEAVIGLNYRSDIAIDDFFVYDGVCGSVVPVLGNPYLCTFEPGICGYQQDKTDKFDWSYLDGPIGPIKGGYFYDYGTHYMVAVAQYPVMSGGAARIYTPPLILPKISACIHFHFWLVLTSGAQFNVYMEAQGSQQQLIYTNSLGTTFWRHELIQTAVPPDGPFMVTFEAIRGVGPERDLIAIDYIEITNC